MAFRTLKNLPCITAEHQAAPGAEVKTTSLTAIRRIRRQGIAARNAIIPSRYCRIRSFTQPAEAPIPGLLSDSDELQCTPWDVWRDMWYLSSHCDVVAKEGLRHNKRLSGPSLYERQSLDRWNLSVWLFPASWRWLQEEKRFIKRSHLYRCSHRYPQEHLCMYLRAWQAICLKGI